MKFEADKDEEGNFKPATVKLSFKNKLINKKLCTYMKALEIRENMLNAKDEYSEEEYADSLQHINENIMAVIIFLTAELFINLHISHKSSAKQRILKKSLYTRLPNISSDCNIFSRVTYSRKQKFKLGQKQNCKRSQNCQHKDNNQ